MRIKRNPYLSPQEIHSALASPLVSLIPHQHSPSYPLHKPHIPTYPPHSQNSASIFDIPLIFDQICASLSNGDILACMAVCKQWTFLARPHHWRSFHYHQNQSYRFHTPVPLITSTVLSHLSEKFSASWVRTLTLDLSCPPLLVLPFSNLVSLFLRCEDFSKSKFPAEEYLKAVELICRNPRLQVLTIRGARVLTRHFDRRLLQFLRNSSLRVLDIECLEYASFDGTLPILKSCPDTLEELRIDLYDQFYDSDNSLRSNAQVTAVTWTLPSLHFLTVTLATLDSQLDIVVCDLIKSCPSLQKLTLHQLHSDEHTMAMTCNIFRVLTNNCPALSSIVMGGPNIPENDMLLFIERCSAIRSIQMHIQPNHLRDVIPSLSRRYSSTLQELVINTDNLPPNSPEFISTILSNCSALKYLSVGRLQSPGIALQELISVKWATTSLERIQLTIRAPDFHQNRLLQEWRQYRCMYLRQDEIEPESEIANFNSQVLLLRRLYEALQTQPNLKIRHFSWSEEWLAIPREFVECITWGYLTFERLRRMCLYLKPLDVIEHAIRADAIRQQEDNLNKKLVSCNITVVQVFPTAFYKEEDEENGSHDGDLDLSSSWMPNDLEYSAYKSRRARASAFRR